MEVYELVCIVKLVRIELFISAKIALIGNST